MIDAGIQQIPVMGNQYKSLLSDKIFLYNFPGILIQMIRRLINQKKIILPGKKNRQHHLRSFAKAQRFERTI